MARIGLFVLAAAVALFSAVSVAEANDKPRIRWQYTNTGMSLEIHHPDGLLGYVVRKDGPKGAVEKNETLTKCPKKADVDLGMVHQQHAHWVFWTPCSGKSQVATQSSGQNNTWEEAEGEDYVPPTPEQSLLWQQADNRTAALRTRIAGLQSRLGASLALALFACAVAGFAVWRATLAIGRPLLPRGGEDG